jgi:hypothetical protein
MQDIARYFPIVTTIFSFIIAREMFNHYLQQKTHYVLCWAFGVLAFGLAALAASINALFGWSAANVKFWYFAGALVGGFPLAQGTLYLLTKRKIADVLAGIFLLVIAVGAVCVALTPLTIPSDFDHQLTGKVFSWRWVRYFPLVTNSYSFFVLVIGGIYSFYLHRTSVGNDSPYLANATIALGSLMPGFGGILMRMGFVNALFVVDFLAMIVIYSGFLILKQNE